MSHSSEDKPQLVEPIARDLEDCYIRVWLDKWNILPGENLEHSIFRDGLDKADVVLVFFTEKSLSSNWVDREINHVLNEQSQLGDTSNLNKIISIYDNQTTRLEVVGKYPILNRSLMFLIDVDYDKLILGQLISAIWGKYLSLRSAGLESEVQLLAKDKAIFQKDKEIQVLKEELKEYTASASQMEERFLQYYKSGILKSFIEARKIIMTSHEIHVDQVPDATAAISLRLMEYSKKSIGDRLTTTELGKDFIAWFLMHKKDLEANV